MVVVVVVVMVVVAGVVVVVVAVVVVVWRMVVVPTRSATPPFTVCFVFVANSSFLWLFSFFFVLLLVFNSLGYVQHQHWSRENHVCVCLQRLVHMRYVYSLLSIIFGILPGDSALPLCCGGKL